jgi:anaerobic dimethyl sulfoxide reductase subunit C (anchor subunit)
VLKEWPLVGFTVLGQAAAGLYLAWFWLPFVLGRGGSADWTGTESRAGLVAALGLLALAAVISLFHLHRPLRAYRALSNVRTSRLSLEILFELAFGFALAAALTASLAEASAGWLPPLHVAAGLGAVLFVSSMARVYMLESVPGWDSWHTPVSFLLTALCLGVTAVPFLKTMVPLRSAPRVGNALAADGATGKVHFMAALVLLAAAFLTAALFFPEKGLAGKKSGPSVKPKRSAPAVLHFLRLFFLLTAAAVVYFFLSGKLLPPGREPSRLVSGLPFFLALTAESAGRFLFYSLAGTSSR